MSTAQVSEPSILTANCYFWTPGKGADSRRRNENRNLSTVASFFKQIGMIVTESGNKVIADKAGVHAEFGYSESCKNVYKFLNITRDGKSSNITLLRKLYNK